MAFDAPAETNGLDRQRFTRIGKFVGATTRPNGGTMDELMRAHGLDCIDFLKCDIGGGEFEMILHDNGFLKRVANIAMELHPGAGEVARLVRALREGGFEIHVTDQFGRLSTLQGGAYLYASRVGALETA